MYSTCGPTPTLQWCSRVPGQEDPLVAGDGAVDDGANAGVEDDEGKLDDRAGRGRGLG